MEGRIYMPDVSSQDEKWIETKRKPTLAYDAGLAVGYNIKDNASLSFGILYNKNAQNYKDWVDLQDGFIIKRSISLHYLKMPLLFHYNYKPEQKISFTCAAGFYLGILLSYKDFIEGTDADGYRATSLAHKSILEFSEYSSSGSDSYYDVFETTPFSKVDFGLILNLGMQIKLTDKLSIPLMLNYQRGITDIKNHASRLIDNTSGSNYLYWAAFSTNDKNIIEPFHNGLIGISTGLRMQID
jgi:hypothetical protein